MLKNFLKTSVSAVLIIAAMAAARQGMNMQNSPTFSFRPASLIQNGAFGSVKTASIQLSKTEAAAVAQSAEPAIVTIYGRQVIQSDPSDEQTSSVMSMSWGKPVDEKIQLTSGTGFFVTPDGYILTAEHVVADSGSSYTVVLSDGTKLTPQIVYRDTTDDIAMLKVDGASFPYLQLGSSSALQEGDQVIGIGDAYGTMKNTVSMGKVVPLEDGVAGSTDSVDGQALPQHMFESDMQLYPGDSGGPTLDSSGNVVGINDAIAVNESNTSFSVPIDYAKSAIQSVLAMNS